MQMTSTLFSLLPRPALWTAVPANTSQMAATQTAPTCLILTLVRARVLSLTHWYVNCADKQTFGWKNSHDRTETDIPSAEALLSVQICSRRSWAIWPVRACLRQQAHTGSQHIPVSNRASDGYVCSVCIWGIHSFHGRTPWLKCHSLYHSELWLTHTVVLLCSFLTLLCFLCASESSMTNSSEVETLAIQPHKLLILDARSYAAAVANRAKGGGCECPGRPFSAQSLGTSRIRSMCTEYSAAHYQPQMLLFPVLYLYYPHNFLLSLFPLSFNIIFLVPEYYPNCEVVFMGMANIHSIRKSFQSLRFLCTQMPDPAKWVFFASSGACSFRLPGCQLWVTARETENYYTQTSVAVL